MYVYMHAYICMQVCIYVMLLLRDALHLEHPTIPVSIPTLMMDSRVRISGRFENFKNY